MATDFSKYQHLVDRFNQRYGVDFNYDDFESEVLLNKHLNENFEPRGFVLSEENNKFIDDFVKLFDKAFVNSVARRIDRFTPEEILNDFIQVMNGYRETYRENGNPLDQEWVANSLLMRNVIDEMGEIPENKQTFIEEEYLRGAFRIRDMRKEAQDLASNNEQSQDPAKLSVILNYANALKKVNDDRPRWWRIIHPFRNAAEKRESQNMRDFVNQKAQAYDRINGEGSCMEKITKYLNDSMIEDIKDSVNKAHAEFKAKEAAEKLMNELKASRAKEDFAEKEIMLDGDNVRENIGKLLGFDIEESFLSDRQIDNKHEEKDHSIDKDSKMI